MGLNKKTVDDINVKGKRVLVRCDFNVPLKDGVITDETRIVAALPTIKKLINDGGKVILCSHLGKVKNGPNEGESLAPVAVRLSEKLGKEVKFVADYNVTAMLFCCRILVSAAKKRPRTAKSSAKSWLIWLMIMYAMHSVLLTEHMHLLQALPSSSPKKAAPMLLVI